MRYLFFAAVLLASVPACAQMPQLTPEQQAAQQRILQLTSDALQWQTQAIALQRQLDADKAEIADLNKKLAEKDKAPPAASSK